MQRGAGACCSHARVLPLLRRLIAFLVLPVPAAAQELPFAVPFVTWDSAALAAQRDSYESAGHEHELLFCVDGWRHVSVDHGVEVFVVLHTRRAALGEAHRVSDVGSLCRDPNGRAMPMLHTHSDGNCQFSPADLTTLAARGAPFDGVQCGVRYFIWESAWRVNAIANELERERAATARRSRP